MLAQIYWARNSAIKHPRETFVTRILMANCMSYCKKTSKFKAACKDDICYTAIAAAINKALTVLTYEARSTPAQCRSNTVECYKSNDSLSTKSKKLSMFNLFRLCGKDEISFFIVAKPATMSKQHSTLSKGQNFTINVRHCCWCGRGPRLFIWRKPTDAKIALRLFCARSIDRSMHHGSCLQLHASRESRDLLNSRKCHITLSHRSVSTVQSCIFRCPVAAHTGLMPWLWHLLYIARRQLNTYRSLSIMSHKRQDAVAYNLVSFTTSSSDQRPNRQTAVYSYL